nr:hypothetical protein [Amylibacter sp.]
MHRIPEEFYQATLAPKRGAIQPAAFSCSFWDIAADSLRTHFIQRLFFFMCSTPVGVCVSLSLFYRGIAPQNAQEKGGFVKSVEIFNRIVAVAGLQDSALKINA